ASASHRAGGVAARREVGDQLVVGDRFEQAEAERRRRDPEDHVVLRQLLGEVGLREGAARRVGAAGDRVQAVDAAVIATVCVLDEARLPDRAIRSDERGDLLSAAGSPVERGQTNLRVGLENVAQSRMGARTTYIWLGMALGTAVAVERRPQ